MRRLQTLRRDLRAPLLGVCNWAVSVNRMTLNLATMDVHKSILVDLWRLPSKTSTSREYRCYPWKHDRSH